MKTVCIVFGLLAISMTAQGLDFAKLAKRSGGQCSAHDELGFLRFVDDFTSVLKNIVTNTKDIKDVLEDFGGLQGWQQFIFNGLFPLADFVEGDEEEGVEQTAEGTAQATTPPPVAKSASVKRSMKQLLDELEKLTHKK